MQTIASELAQLKAMLVALREDMNNVKADIADIKHNSEVTNDSLIDIKDIVMETSCEVYLIKDITEQLETIAEKMAGGMSETNDRAELLSSDVNYHDGYVLGLETLNEVRQLKKEVQDLGTMFMQS
jgi:methyl-accepting chemotaxis protein